MQLLTNKQEHQLPIRGLSGSLVPYENSCRRRQNGNCVDQVEDSRWAEGYR